MENRLCKITNMTILGIETSCDETSAAVINGKNEKAVLLSNYTATSLTMHAKTGGVIPEIAAREQIKYMIPVIRRAVSAAFNIPDTFDPLDTFRFIDAIAVTYGPGLIGSLLVGVETARTIAFAFNTPIIPINHMVGHIYANWLTANDTVSKAEKKHTNDYLPPAFPALAVVISGGHTDILLMESHGSFVLLGGTRDDAAGEAFDKIGRLLNLPYPAGPTIEKLAKQGDPTHFRFPRPLHDSNDYDWSFSGLKTAVLREVKSLKQIDEQTVCDIARATQDAIIDVIILKTLRATKEFRVKTILLSGGVAANYTLREHFIQKIKNQEIAVDFLAPAKHLCTDNAAMIAAAAYFNYHPVNWQEVTADPELYFV